MIRFRGIKYYNENNCDYFSFKLADENIIGFANLENNKKIVYTKLAKFYGIKRFTKYRKDDLIQLLVDQQGFEHKATEVTDKCENELVKSLNKCVINEDSREIDYIQDKLSDLKIRINPIDEMNNKIKELDKSDPLYNNKVNSIKNCYAYRNWLWIYHNITYEEEMERVIKIMES